MLMTGEQGLKDSLTHLCRVSSGVIPVQLQAKHYYADFQAACNHLTHSPMGSQPVSKVERARRSNDNTGRQSEGLLIEPSL